MATFVLVPGAGVGAWIWDRVVPLLEAAGHVAAPVALTGLGERAHLAAPDVDLRAHVAERCAGRVVRLVSIDGFAPVDGEAVADICPEFVA